MTTFHRSLQFNKHKNFNKKCGEITFCLQIDKRVYALNCIYCSQIFLHWDLFIHHMEQEHDEQLNIDSILNVDDDIQDKESEKSQRNNDSSMFNKHNESDSFSYNDPLEEESSINSLSLEKSIKIEKNDCVPNHTFNENMDTIGSDNDKNNDVMDLNTQFPCNVDNQGMEHSIDKDIQQIKEKLKANNRLIQQLFAEIRIIKHKNLTDITTTTKLLPKLPFENKEAFLKFETMIQETEEKFSSLVKELKQRVNGNSVKFIKNCWRLLIKDEVAKEFCWQGSKEKTEIKNFSTMLAIKLAYTQKFTDHNTTEFERVVIMHFQQAKNRCEKRIKQ